MKLKAIVMTITLLALLLSPMLGCNAWRGAGKDMEHAGERMQDKE